MGNECIWYSVKILIVIKNKTRRRNIMKNLNVAVNSEVYRLGDMALKGVASAALKVTTVNVRTCCWFVLGQDRLPDGAEKLRRI